MRICWIPIALLSLIVSCGIDSILDDDASRPRKRPAMRSDTRCYDSFRQFKNTHGNAGKDREWHHIVGQHSKNKGTFGEHDLHCTDNLISLPESVHHQINGHYNTKPDWAGGDNVRNWLAKKTFAEQYEYGIKLLKKYGYEK